MNKHANQEQIGGQSVQGKKCWCWTLLVNRFGFPLALATVEKYILKNREEILNTIKSSPYDERQQQSSGAGQPSPFYICILTFSIIFLLIFLPPFQFCCLFFCHPFGCFAEHDSSSFVLYRSCLCPGVTIPDKQIKERSLSCYSAINNMSGPG